MIDKILSLSNIGRFERFSASGDVSFKKYTLIFAENGVGKTTLCDVIRSLQTGNPDYIHGRRTLGSPAAPEAKIRLIDGSTAYFSAGSWSKIPPGGCTIFDSSYVRRNVHAGEIVDTEHKRNMFQLIVGEEGVTLVERVNAIEKERSDLNAPLRSSKAALDAALPPGMKLATFLALEPDDNIDKRIEDARQTLEAARHQTVVSRHQGLTLVDIPHFPENIYQVLEMTLVGVSAAAERLLNDHLEHLAYERGEAWLSRGLSLTAGDNCPFCAQDIRNNSLVDAYKICFSQAYKTLKDSVEEIRTDVEHSFGEGAQARIETVLARNAEAFGFWLKFCSLPALPELDPSLMRMIILNLAAVTRSALDHKLSNILEPADHRLELEPHIVALGSLCGDLSDYNEAVARNNGVIEERRRALATVDAASAEKSLHILVATKRRFDASIHLTCETYRELQGRRDQLDAEKSSAKAALDAHTGSVIRTYETTLNGYLDSFFVGFRIRGTKAEFPRGYPSSSYQIVINDVPVELGNQDTGLHQPSFQNTLSGGDRSALALSFFMAQLEQAVARPEIAVILDDPFQSQDAFRKTATAFQIKRCGTRCGQVIVLSHDPHFLKLVWDELPPAERKSLRLHPVGRGTSMSPWDINETLKLEHQARIEVMQRFVQQGTGDPRDVAQKLRPGLEGYCKLVCPDEFRDGIMIGDICKAVRSSGTAHPLFGVLEEIEIINSFAKKYHHTNPNAATERLNEIELIGYCRKLLSLMRIRT